METHEPYRVCIETGAHTHMRYFMGLIVGFIGETVVLTGVIVNDIAGALLFLLGCGIIFWAGYFSNNGGQ